MNMKKIKKFFTLARRHDGFTLVELIVVIAILAILGGVAVPAYNGYVKKANMQADMTLLSEVKHAVELAYYSNPSYRGVEMIVITLDETYVSGDDNSFLDNAMKATFGDSYETLTLKYDNWGNGASITADVLAHFLGQQDGDLADVYNGNSVPTFAENVDDLFVMIRDTALLIADKSERYDFLDIESGAELLKYASEYDEGDFSDVEDFKVAWAALRPVGDIAGTGDSNILDKSEFTAENIAPAIATAAVVKARNTAVATYLQNQDPAYTKYADAISNLGGTVPEDLAEVIAAHGNGLGEFDVEAIAVDLGVADDPDFDMNEFAAAFSAARNYFYDDGSGSSPAERDAMAYYAMMDTVKATNDTTSENDDEYWDELAGAVSIYGQIASGKLSLEDALSAYSGNIPENSIAVLVISDGSEFAIKVNPTRVME